MSHKTLITSGCSFTQTELPCIDRKFNTWPQQLATKYNLNLINYGFFATGNSMIARTLIYGVSEFLKESKDLIVGVMWSGQDRHAFYSEDARRPAKFNMPIGPRKFIRTPIDVLHPNTQHTDMGGWINLLLGTSTIENFPYQHLNNAWYKNFNNRTFSEITTLENILWAQNFLELHNIDYFMSGFTDDSLTFNINNENIKWLEGTTPISKADIEAKMAELPTEEEERTARENLKASAKAKLIAGEPLTEEEANTIVL